MDDMARLEAAADELVAQFEVKQPPVPIEIMLARPGPDMWEEVDITQLSGTFLSIKDPYRPRMSFARMLARHVAKSPWGEKHHVKAILDHGGEEAISVFARMMIMPRGMVDALNNASRNPTAMSMRFEVPEDDARQRLLELDGRG